MIPSASAIELINYGGQQRSYAQQYVIKTDVNGIMQDTNGNYAMVLTDPATRAQIFTPVGRCNVQLTSKSSVDGESFKNANDWMLGCVSSSATINEFWFSYDFYDNGQRKTAGDLLIFCDIDKYSEHYQNGYLEKAWSCLHNPWVDDSICVKIGSKTFILT